MDECYLNFKLINNVKFSDLTYLKSSILQLESQLSTNFTIIPANTECLGSRPINAKPRLLGLE